MTYAHPCRSPQEARQKHPAFSLLRWRQTAAHPTSYSGKVNTQPSERDSDVQQPEVKSVRGTFHCLFVSWPFSGQPKTYNSLCQRKGHVLHPCLLEHRNCQLCSLKRSCLLPEMKLHISGNLNFRSIKAGAQTLLRLLFKMIHHDLFFQVPFKEKFVDNFCP